MPTYPTTKASPDGPALEGGGAKMTIRGPRAEISPGSAIVVSGAFRITGDDIAATSPSPHRALVLVVTSRDSFFAGNPFEGVTLFPDDVQKGEGSVAGHFQVDAHAMTGLRHPGQYYMVCALGSVASNVVEFRIL